MLNKKHLFAALKIALIGVLFAVIFYNISWVDRHSRLDLQGTVLAETEGQIVGPDIIAPPYWESVGRALR